MPCKRKAQRFRSVKCRHKPACVTEKPSWVYALLATRRSSQALLLAARSAASPRMQPARSSKQQRIQSFMTTIRSMKPPFHTSNKHGASYLLAALSTPAKGALVRRHAVIACSCTAPSLLHRRMLFPTGCPACQQAVTLMLPLDVPCASCAGF